jgi:divalent metal cation (Fe/Co/Zn/Cd) transporter
VRPEGVAEIVSGRMEAVAGVLGVDNVRLRSVGPRHFVEATLSLPRSLGLEQVAEVKSGAVKAAHSVLPDAEVTLQSMPVSPSDETVHERVLLVALRERVAVHHITVQHLGDDLAIVLDLEVDGAMPLADAHAVADRLEAAVRREFGERTEIDIHIEPLEPEVRDVVDLPAAVKQDFVTIA